MQKGVRTRSLKEVMPYFIMLILLLNQKNVMAFGLVPEPGCTVVLILYSLANLAKVITRCQFSHPCTVRLFTGTQKTFRLIMRDIQETKYTHFLSKQQQHSILGM